jgi:hypothetical protein
VWEEYRGFCNNDESHFRLDLDSAAANTRRQIIVIDENEILDYWTVDGFMSRLNEMMNCSLVIANDIITSPVEGNFYHNGNEVPWDAYERIDTYQAYWDANQNSWCPNTLTNPHYLIPAPADSSDLERSSDQVAICLCDGETDGCPGLTAHKRGYGTCGNAGVAINYEEVHDEVLSFLPQLANNTYWKNRIFEICDRRLLAHEMGHTINTPDHCEGYLCDQCQGDDMCVMKNEIACWVVPDDEYNELAWSEWVQRWEDGTTGRWGYFNYYTWHCADSIRYRQ